ncbi:hypothetical protein PsorP6_015960 [Peronosclerospora sorghi]|uniref:Uncharacterized protein n=1 Tax=Peronosclerospora sorghi TaxID=230839 RepID=A0ACC0WM24_9STRA|nr:hypothetical protein PsorP6_015960 [Peronosclerospora sorghi]
MARTACYGVISALRRKARARPTQVHLLLCALGLAALVLVGECLLLSRRRIPDYYTRVVLDERENFYPPYVLASNWAHDVDRAQLLHLNRLHEACLNSTASVIPWTYGLDAHAMRHKDLIHPDDPHLLEKMRQCPDVDVFMPEGLRRSRGYCEDATAYTKYLEARMLPEWAVAMNYTDATTGAMLSYHDLCPRTPMLFFNHYWNSVPDAPTWPATKPLYLMPNIEMYELTPEHYWRADVVLCKTAICARRVKLWYEQQGNPRHTKVVYTRHTTSDVATLARHEFGDDALTPKNWSDVHFIHAAGTSVQKGTKQVLDCWVRRRDFPPLEIYVNESIYTSQLKPQYERRLNHSRVHFHVGITGTLEFSKLIAESAFSLCTSVQEGYGHYINQARASGTLIVSTDLPPMNELLTPESAVLIPVKRFSFYKQLLGGVYPKDHGLKEVHGLVAALGGNGICQAVEKVLAMSPLEREAMARRAKQQYFIDLNFFAFKMKEVRKLARETTMRLRSDVGA